MITLKEYYKIFESENRDIIDEGLFDGLFGSSDKQKYNSISTLCIQYYDAKMKEQKIRLDQAEAQSKKKGKGSNSVKAEAMNARLTAASSIISSLTTQINATIDSLGGDWKDKAVALFNDTELRVQKDIMEMAERVLDDDSLEDFKKSYDEDEEDDDEKSKALERWWKKHKLTGVKDDIIDFSQVDKKDVDDGITKDVEDTYVNLNTNSQICKAYRIKGDSIIKSYFIKVKFDEFKPIYFALEKRVADNRKLKYS